MPLRSIPAEFFDTTIKLQRRSLTADSIGDFTETWNNLDLALPATIQPLNIRELASLPQGKEYVADHKAFLPYAIPHIPRNGDRVINNKGNIIYNVISAQLFRASRKSVTTGQHYRLYLQIPRDIKT